METPGELRIEPRGDLPVLPTGSPLPTGSGGIEVSTAERMRDGLREDASPQIGVDGALAAEGWGSGVIAVPPGRRLIRIERAGTETLSRVEDVAEGHTLGLDFRVSIVRGRNGYYAGYPGFGLKGRTRSVNEFPSGRSASTLFYLLPMMIGGVIMGTAVSLSTIFADGRLQQLLMIGPPTVVIVALAITVPVLMSRHRRGVERELAHEPRQWGDAWRVFDGGPMPQLPANRGALLLDLRVRRFVVGHAGWTPPPRLRVDGHEIPIDYGLWWIPVVAGEHGVEVTPPGNEPAARQRTVTVVAGRTHRGQATVRGFGAAADVHGTPQLKVTFRLK